MNWRWLFDVESWLMRNDRVDRPIWVLFRRPASALTRRLERRGRML